MHKQLTIETKVSAKCADFAAFGWMALGAGEWDRVRSVEALSCEVALAIVLERRT